MKKQGKLEVIAGPMYSGKTEELIRLAKRAVIGKKRVKVFKPTLDTRYGKEKKLYSHAGLVFNAKLIKGALDIKRLVSKTTDLVCIDEAQWLGKELIPVIEELLEGGKWVIVTGLALTYDKQPFTPIPELMAMADTVTKLSAICSICGSDAVYHKRLTKTGVSIDPKTADPSLVGGLLQASYEARCRNCY